MTGAVWLDGDGDGKRSSAHDTAKKLVADTGTDWRKAVQALAAYDEAVAAQAAGERVLRGFDAYAEAWRESQIASQDMKP